MTTLPELDTLLHAAREAYLTHLDHGELDKADQAWQELDRLLEQRLHAHED